MNEWISVEDRLPEGISDEYDVWIDAPSYANDDIAYFEAGHWFRREDDSFLKHVTHWQPRPDPPETD